MTLPANLPDAFRKAAHDFADALRDSFTSGMPAQPEDQLKAPVQTLLKSAAAKVLTKTEAQVHDLGGRPDIGVEVSNLLCGFVELKALGLGANAPKFKGRDKAQWEKFKELPNILYTDAIEWAHRNIAALPHVCQICLTISHRIGIDRHRDDQCPHRAASPGSLAGRQAQSG